MAWQNDEDESDSESADPGPDESDLSDEPAETPCLYCNRQIPEDAPRCPYCGCYISEEDAPRRRSWLWIIAVILLVLLLMAYLLWW